MSKGLISQKSLLLISLSIIALFLIMFILISSIYRAQKNTVSLYKDRLLALEQLKAISEKYSFRLLLVATEVSNGSIDWDIARQQLLKISEKCEQMWRDYQGTYLTDKEKVLLDKSIYLKTAADSAFNGVLNILNEGRSMESIKKINDFYSFDVLVQIKPFLESINELDKIQSSEAAKLQSLTNDSFLKITLLSIAMMLLFLGNIWLFYNKSILETKLNNLTAELKAKNHELINTNEELNTTIEELDSTLEELDASNEELSNANEELIASNEKLTSLNEQLEFHKNNLEKIVEERSNELFISEARYKNIFENANDAILILKEDIIIDCNSIAANLFSTTKDELTGKSPVSFSMLLQPDGVTSKMKGQLYIEQALKGIPQRFEWQHIINKKILYVDVSLSRLEFNHDIFLQAIIRDITQRKDYEYKIEESQTKLNAIFESTNDLIFAVDSENFNVITFNSSAYEFFLKYRNISIDVGTHFKQIFRPEKVDTWRNYFQKVIENGPFETEYSTYDNSFVFLISFYPLKKENKVFGISVFARDITQIKLAEEQMKVLNHSIDIAPDSAYWVDSSGHFIYVNETGYKRLGYSKAEILNLSIKDVSPSYTPERWADVLNILRERGNFFAELTHRRKDGTLFPVEITSSHIKYNGKEFIHSFAKDITSRKIMEQALKESEELYRQVTILSGYIVFDYNPDDNSVKWNGALQQVFGYSPEEFEDSNFETWVSLVHPDDRVKTLKTFSTALANDVNYNAEYRFKIKNGSYLWIEADGYKISHHNKSAYRVIGVMKDITERKKLEQQILTSVIETEEKERMNFSQELHDGIGPLISAIKMYVQLLKMKDTQMKNDEIADKAEMLIDEAAHSLREISFKLSPHILQNYGLVEALTTYIEKIKETRKIGINLKSNKVDRFADFKETIIYRVICECINNTIKHAHAGKAELSLYQYEDTLKIDYSDDGKGFDIEKIFAGKRGIGLLNMQSRIKSIGGQMVINSLPGSGTDIKIKVKL